MVEYGLRARWMDRCGLCQRQWRNGVTKAQIVWAYPPHVPPFLLFLFMYDRDHIEDSDDVEMISWRKAEDGESGGICMPCIRFCSLY